MKYQIYLNKETSISINQLAEKNSTKPNTFIKKFLESFMRIYNSSAPTVEESLKKEILKNGDK